jgi:hypothetical protein
MVFVVAVETHSEGDQEVLVEAANEDAAVDLAWDWADRVGGDHWAQDVWTRGTQAAVEATGESTANLDKIN